MKNKMMILNAALIFSIAGLLGCQDSTPVANLAKPVAPAASPAANVETSDFKKYSTVAEVPRISVEDAKKAFDDGNAFFVDSRPESAYKAEHILGAMNIPNGANASEKFSSLPKGKKIIVYCS